MKEFEYRGFTIKPKLDFGSGPGYLINGKYVKTGWVVVFGGCNIMPGAAWFTTIEDAELGIDCLLDAGFDFYAASLLENGCTFSSNKFYELYRSRKNKEAA